MHILVFWVAALALAPLGLGIVLQALSLSRGTATTATSERPAKLRSQAGVPTPGIRVPIGGEV